MNDMTPQMKAADPRLRTAESALRKVSGIVEWTCVDSAQGLVAYVVAASDAEFGQAAEAVRSLVETVVRLSRLPRDAEGRVDFSSLPSPFAVEVTAGEGEEAGPLTPALLDGGPLRDVEGAPRMLGEVLRRAALDPAGRGITFIDGRGEATRLSYADLYAEASACAAELRRWRHEGYQHAVICCAERRAFLRAFWGCQLVGLVAVPCELGLDKGTDPRRALDAILSTLGPTLVLVGEQESAALGDPGGGALTVAIPNCADAAVPAVEPFAARPDDLALLLSTSGSTGSAKLVMQTHDRLLAYCQGSIRRFGLGAEMVSLNWFPLTHVGGLVMYHLRDLVARCDQIQVATEYVLRRPIAWLELMDRFRVTNSWAPNFAYALVAEELGRDPERQFDLSRVTLLLNGGELIVARQASAFLAAAKPFGLSQTAMLPAWGMSETCSGVLYGPREIPADGPVAVGTPMPGCAVRITDGAGRILNRGETGELEVRGASVLAGYFRNPEANRSTFTEDGWFRTGDLARIGDDGVVIQGRSKDTLIVNGLNIPATDLEQVADALEGVEASFSAAVAIRGASDTTDRVLMLVVPREGHDPAQVCSVVTAAVHRETGVRPAWVRAVARDDVPKTAIGKIRRQEIQRQWTARLTTDPAAALPIHRPVWHRFATERSGAGDRRILVVAGAAASSAATAEALRDLRVVEQYSADDQDSRLRLAQALAEEAGAGERVHVTLIVAPRAAAADAARSALAALWSVASLLAEPAFRRRAVLTAFLSGRGEGDRLWMEPAAAFARCIASELSGLPVRTVTSTDEEPNLAAVVRAAFSPHDLVLERDDFATRRLEAVVPHAAACSAAPGKVHVVTGGLGAIGQQLCRHLVDRGAAGLILLGRRPLEAAPEAQRLAWREIAASTGAVYLSWQGAAATGAALVEAVSEAQQRTGAPLGGIFHLAGSLAYGTLDDGWPARFDEAWASKAAVADALVGLAGEHPSSPLVFFSSLASRFGGVGVAAHAAANAYLGELCDLLNARHQARAYALDWSIWAGVGQSVGRTDPEAARRSGFESVSSDGGFAALEQVLSLDPGCYLLGLNESVPAVAWRCEPVAVVPTVDAPAETAHAPEPVPPAAPSVRDGALRLKAVLHRPRTVEADVAAIWRSLLALDQLDRNDSFFDLGGNSLLVPRVQEAVATQFGVELKPVDVFRYPTVATLSAHINSLTAA